MARNFENGRTLKRLFPRHNKSRNAFGVSGASVRAAARNTVGAEVGQKVVVESSTKRLLGVMLLVNLLPVLCFFVGYFATGALSSEGLRYAIAIAAFLLGLVPAVVCDRRMKRTGALTFTIVRLF